MKRLAGSSKLYFLSLSILILLLSSFYVPDKVRFAPMLLKKTDVDKLMANNNFSYMILQNMNSGGKDAKRQAYELICYAFTSNKTLIAPYNPFKLMTSVPDSAYVKDIYFVNYTLTKGDISSILPGNASYSFLRFQPYEDKSDPILANYISYSVYPVAADGITPVLKSKATSITPKKLNPSPPR